MTGEEINTANKSAPEVTNNQATGLTGDQVQKRLEEFGPNAVPDAAMHPLRRAFGKFWAPVPWMLEAAAALQLALGKYFEGAIIAGLLVFNAALAFLQEGRAQATLAALKSRLALNASVRRDNVWSTIPAVGLVPGDIVKLSLGAVVPADVRLISGEVLLDQSMLTGESVPIEAGKGYQTFAGALVKRGEAVAEVTATGANTKFGRTAELIRTAYVVSSQQKAVLRVVRNLSLFNSALIIVIVVYAHFLKMPVSEIISLALTAILASIPVALPATFTLAAARGAKSLTKLGVLPTRLSAVDEAASMDVLCADKTGTLTCNELKVAAVQCLPDTDESHVLAFAALASSEGGQDPIDAAIRSASSTRPAPDLPKLIKFVPFDPATKMSEAAASYNGGAELRVVKGAFSVISSLAEPAPNSEDMAEKLEKQGYRVLAVAMGPAEAMKLLGLIALSDPPRDDSSALITELKTLGIHTLMVTGDAPATAAIVARSVGLDGAISPPGPIPPSIRPEQFAVFAGTLPEDKFNLVKAFQKEGNIVGMCGDGANDAPALRQAQMGIAVSTATDAAKSAAGIVLIEPGLSGIVASVKEGRITFQRILTYILNSMTKKIVVVLFLVIGLIMTKHAILTPMLMVILLITGDFLTLSLTADNVRPSPQPNAWRIGNLTIAAVVMGACELAFCTIILAIGKYYLMFGIDSLRSLTAALIVFGGEATLYTVRERGRILFSRPGKWVVLASLIDVSNITILASFGILLTHLPIIILASTFAASVVFSLLMHTIRRPLFTFLQIS